VNNSLLPILIALMGGGIVIYLITRPKAPAVIYAPAPQPVGVNPGNAAGAAQFKQPVVTPDPTAGIIVATGQGIGALATGVGAILSAVL
jgi:hypothetical protein